MLHCVEDKMADLIREDQEHLYTSYTYVSASFESEIGYTSCNFHLLQHHLIGTTIIARWGFFNVIVILDYPGLL